MTSSSAKWLTAMSVVLVACGGAAAWAEQYKVVASDSATICQSSTKTDPVVVEGPDDVTIAAADGDAVNAAVCVSDGSQSNLHIQWKAAGAWKSSGNLTHSCAEILGASVVMVRAVNTNDVQSATYYTCGLEQAPPAQ